GRLDTVLQASPEDRRGFIEEAAGILKHRRRKEKTLRKLDAMQANLTRLSDLAGEVRRQLKPLGRQAEIAREAQAIAADVRDAKARLFADDVVTLRAALAAHTRAEQELHTERLVLSDQIENTRARIAALQQAQSSVAVDEARSVLFGLEQVQERMRGLFTLANQRLALLGSDNDERGAASVTVSQAQIDAARAEIDEISAGLGEAQDAAQSASREVMRARAELDALDLDIAEQSALVSQHDMRITSLRGTAEAAASTLAAVRSGVARQQAALAAAEERRREAQDVLASIEEAEAPSGTVAEHSASYESAQRAASDAELALESLREQLHGAEREADALIAKVAALGSALSITGGAAEIVATGGTGIRGLVSDAVQVQPGYEAAIAAVLGPLAEGVLVEDFETAFAVAAEAADGRRGVIDIVIADTPHMRAVEGAAGARPAVEVVNAPAGIRNILSHVLVADDLPAARNAQTALGNESEVPLTIVTRAGDVLTDSTVRSGLGGDRSRLELAAERDAAAERLDDVQRRVAELRALRAEAR
ncbi:MAG: chromosome segregation protein SMC, partial [Candidatus Cloacimonetes bacterium]|nr:chromosome segregation protein SMC [Candidatus Cloacimonadota bacterium]